MFLREFLYLYLIVINIVSFICFFIDKRRARKGLWRISESFLFGISILGGSLGAMLGMKVFHHKTRKIKFIIGIPIVFILNVGLLFYLEQILVK